MKKSIALFLLVIAMCASCASRTVYLRNAPPARKAEIQSPRPGKNFIWVNGYWQWNPRNKSYVWISGYWKPVKPGRKWENGYWKKTPRGWIWIKGSWKK